MNRIARRSLLGGLAAAGAATLLPQVSQADVRSGAAGTAGRSAAPIAAKPKPLQTPPNINVITNNGGTAPGQLFLSVNGFANQGAAQGLVIVDDQGQVLSYRPVAGGTYATDFRVQTYQGQQVLTWWEGPIQGAGVGNGRCYVADANFNIIAQVGQGLDLHEFRLTDQDTAMVIAFQQVPADLSPVGGPSNGTAYDGVVQEIDIASGQVVFEWRSLEHVPLTESTVPYFGFGAYDYMHTNSVAFDSDGNLLISGRFTNTLYKVDRSTGEVIWRLGGNASSFQMGAGAVFIGQHDGEVDGGNVYRIFDNATSLFTLQGDPIGPVRDPAPAQGASRVVFVSVDEATGTASMVSEIRHPQGMSVFAEGGAERLSNDNVLVSWGSAGRISEFSPNGELLFEVALDQGMSSYRAYRFEWQG